MESDHRADLASSIIADAVEVKKRPKAKEPKKIPSDAQTKKLAKALADES